MVGGSSLLWAGNIPRQAGLGCFRKTADHEPWGEPEGSIALRFRPLLPACVPAMTSLSDKL